MHLVRVNVNVSSGDDQFSWPLTYREHRFHTIYDQVQQHLLQTALGRPQQVKSRPCPVGPTEGPIRTPSMASV